MMKGFIFPYKGKDIFVVTEKTRKTKDLAKRILRKMNLPDNPGTVSDLLYWLQAGCCEIKRLANGREYYEIFGDKYGGRGSFVDDGKTEIINLDQGGCKL